MSTHTVIGQRLPRIDALGKATGETRYTADMRIPGVLHGKALRSPYPHAMIRHIDTSRARRLGGVSVVLTAEDTPKLRYGMMVEDEYPLAVDKVRYIGDEVALVAAIDEDIAEEALGLIQVEYEELPAVFDPLEAMKDGAPLIHEAARNIAMEAHFQRGDVGRAFGEADHVIEEVFETSFHHQAYLEPTACLAEPSAGDRVTVWGPFQAVFYARDLVSKALGVPVSKVRCVQAPVGGAFGAKLDCKLWTLTALLALKCGRPVRMVMSRYEEFVAARPRVPMRIELKMGLKSDGIILGKQVKIVANNGAYTSLAKAVPISSATRTDCLYRIQHTRADVHLVYTNCIPTGQFRGYGNPQGTFAAECLLDTVASKLGIDPVEIRLKNAIGPGEKTVHGWVLGSCGLREAIEQASAAAEWKVKRTRKQQGSRRRGIGIACAVHNSGNRLFGFDGSTAYVRVERDGRLKLFTGESDLGQGAYTVLAQVAAEVFGVSLDQVDVATVDTETSPHCLGTFGSRVTTIGGHAVLVAARDARRQLLEAAAVKLEVSAHDLTAAGGRICVRGVPTVGLTYGEAVEAHGSTRGGAPILGVGTFDSNNTVVPDPETKYGNYSMAYSFAAQIAEVEVDLETGLVRVLDVWAAHDLGRAINPAAAEGQIEGGVVQGVGWALWEGEILDGGQVTNASFADYIIPSFRDAPRVRPILVELTDPLGPAGAKGVAETAIDPTAAAVANAIFDATGVRMTSLPITAEKIYRALRGEKND